jgi:hypothetical protein
MNKLFFSTALTVLTLFCTGCAEEDLSAGRNPRTTYGLDTIKIEKQLEFKEEPSKLSFTFWCTRSSSRYRFELFYPLIPSHQKLKMEEEAVYHRQGIENHYNQKYTSETSGSYGRYELVVRPNPDGQTYTHINDPILKRERNRIIMQI